MTSDVSPLDVLEGFFGGLPDESAIQGLASEQLDELGDLVQQSAAASARERVPTGAVGELVYPGGWLASGWGQELFRVELSCALLYETRLLVHDPLAEYFFSDFRTLPKMRTIKGAVGSSIYAGPDLWANYGRRVHRGDDLEHVRHDLMRIVRFLLDVEPLLRSGVMVMRSQWPTLSRRQRHLMASAKADMADAEMLAAAFESGPQGGDLPRWDNLRGGHVTPPGGLLDPMDPAQWQPEFFYLAKSLAVADAAGAVYTPATRDELRLLIAKTGTIDRGRRTAPTQPLLREVLSVVVPDLRLSPSAAVKIRSSEQSFEDWRIALRDLQREAATTDPADLSELVQDRIQPQVTAVTRAVSLSATLREHAGPSAAAALLGTAGNLITGAGPVPSATAAGLTGVAAWLMNAYGGRRTEGRQAVVAALLTGRSSTGRNGSR